MLNNNFLMLLKLGKVCLNLDPLIKAVSPIAIFVLTIILAVIYWIVSVTFGWFITVSRHSFDHFSLSDHMGFMLESILSNVIQLG